MSILVNVPRALEKSVPSMLIRPRRGIVLFGLIYPHWFPVCLFYQLQGEKSHHFSPELWVSPSSSTALLMYFEGVVRRVHV